MAKNFSKRKAFTIVEILIALVIFSMALLIVAGIFMSVIGSQSSINVNAEVSKEAQRVMRQISDDIVNATATANVQRFGNAGTTLQHPVGLLLIRPNGRQFSDSALKSCLGSSASNCVATQLILFGDGKNKIYRLDSANNQLEYAEGSGAITIASDGEVDTSAYNFSPLLSEKVEIGLLSFRGLQCSTSTVSCKVAPYVQTELIVQTKDYSTQGTNQRAKLHLRTLTTSRSYQN